MAIRTTYGNRKSQKSVLVFRESKLAHEWCKGNGIELGAGAHNPFNLPGCINVAPGDDPFFRDNEVEMCGRYAEIDVKAEANSIPLPDDSQDYVISSHVVEHLPNPIGAFLEWNRLLKPGGIIFMVLPLPSAHPGDIGRELVTLEQFEEAYQNGYTVDNFPDESITKRGHYYVYNLEIMIELIRHCNTNHSLDWEIVATEATDSKVGNGFTVVARYMPVKPSENQQENRDGTIPSKESDVEAVGVRAADDAGENLLGQDTDTGSGQSKTRSRKGKTPSQP